VCSDAIPQEFNARTRVHEYGGGDYLVHQGAIYFSNFADQRLYRLDASGSPQAVTAKGAVRYTDCSMDVTRNRLIGVREDHSLAEHEPINSIVALKLEGPEKHGELLVSGNDFYSNPRLSPDGKKLAWLTWNHPNMPWDETQLWVGDISPTGSIENRRHVAGGDEESIFQPEWSPNGQLYFVSDGSGWWNLWRLNESNEVEALCPRQADFGLPQWIFGMSTYGFASPDQIVTSYIEDGLSQLATIHLRSGELEKISTEFTDISFVRADRGRAVFLGGSPTQAASIVTLDLATQQLEMIRRSNTLEIDSGYISRPQAIDFPTENGQTAHGFFYPPQNADFRGPENELPPLLVKSHGGPTAAAGTALSWTIQYWTSRGIAVMDVNYGGSTGYGRDYRERLKGKWGLVDVDDCVNAARYLVEQRIVDPQRLMITGASAGGYTTLCALTFRNTFKAGGSHFGVSDAESLARDTHKFESRYLDQLFGPYPERRDIYYERSPINFADRLSCPVIFFQGLEDKVVPPDQAQQMVEVLKRKGIPVAYVAFAGEQHGFRQAENIKRTLEGELYFYSRVFGFELADKVEPVEIENLSVR
jgi:dipeptidyl aminopeptidase/acylaminoacyl peptidase